MVFSEAMNSMQDNYLNLFNDDYCDRMDDCGC